ncbi:pyridoxal phosphate-dependent transferase, partial [Pavlovales sp. CCMP2436]
GTCGPRAFYGTLDLHMDLESELAAFLGTERSLVYSSAVATVSSILPAFAKRGDTVFVDDGAHANARIRNGVELTRSRVRVYPRGDVAALKELLLEQQEALDARLPAANVGRRLIVAEGVCAATGDIAPLPALLELRDAHGAYLFVDETHSLGVVRASPPSSHTHTHTHTHTAPPCPHPPPPPTATSYCLHPPLPLLPPLTPFPPCPLLLPLLPTPPPQLGAHGKGVAEHYRIPPSVRAQIYKPE